MKSFYKNEYLFSETYLQEITQVREDPTVKATLKTLKEYRDYADTSSLEAWNVSFVHEIFNALRFGVKKIDGNTALLYQLGSDATITLCYSLLPTEDLDSTIMGQNWSEKIIRNLRNNQLKWGILTNGDHWRIYYTEEPTPYENYLEIDLKGIMDSEDVPQYQIFNKFMKAENFIPDKDGNCQFDIFKKESQDRINYIEEELKNALKQKEEGGKGILSNICMGYVGYLRETENPDFSDEGLRDTIYGSAMLYMFRLLFLFCAKARGLLKESNQELFSEVLLESKKAQEQNIPGKDEYAIWNDLRELFSNIDLTYNGGLFNPAENEFVEEKRLSNTYLAPVIYFMTFYKDKADKQQLISYRDMGVRHLGSLYEGLLEHKLFVADEDTEVEVTKSEVKFIPASEGGKIVEGKYIPIGQVYFSSDKGFRKASGSYYTPEYVVEYIVQNTVGMKLEELRDAFSIKNKNTIDSIETALNDGEKAAFTDLLRKDLEEFIQNSVLNFSVLDPAMGSGHFLVNATNHISNFLTEFSNHFSFLNGKDTSTAFWRRRVVENCIYGVDVNFLAVELAKLSLWILSMAKDHPLSFLDHHLKCGDSLIGTKLSDIGFYPRKKGLRSSDRPQLGLFENDHDFKAAVEEAVYKYRQIQTNDSRELGDIGDKKQWLDEVNDALKPYKGLSDFHTSILFGNDVSENEYVKVISSFNSAFICDDDALFHWELEFPEIMIGENGFDIVIGNPPYVKERDNKKVFELVNKSNLGIKYHQGKMDYWYYFLHIAIDILKSRGLVSYITSSYWLNSEGARKLIQRIRSEVNFVEIIDIGNLKVFDNVSGRHMVSVYIKEKEGDDFDYIKLNKSLSEITYRKNCDTFLLKNSNIFSDSNEIMLINDKINYEDTVNLGDICDISQGVVQNPDKVTSKASARFNLPKGAGVFVIDQEEYESLNLNNEEKELVKKFFDENEIYKYHIRPTYKKFLIYLTKKNCSDVSSYSNLESHLFKFKKIMDERRETKNGSNKWFHLHWPREEKYFVSEKVVVPSMFSKPNAAYQAEEGFFGLSSNVIISRDKNCDLKYILGILNSKLANYWFYSKGKKRGSGVDIGVKKLRSFPVKVCSKDVQDKLVKLVNEMIACYKTGDNSGDTSKQYVLQENQNKIDELIYEIYQLSDDEIKIVEGEV